MYQYVKQILDNRIKRDVVLEVPKDSKMGHFSTTIAFVLSKEYKDSPKNIANNLILSLKDVKEFAKLQEVNGFINITLSRDFISKIAQSFILDKDCRSRISSNKILIEYVSANPTGPLHIGHARGAVIGDTLSRIGRYIGYDITTEYYVNDAGNQIELLGKSIFINARKLLNLDSNINDDDIYKGSYIIDLAQDALNKFDKNIFLSNSNINLLSNFALEKMLLVIKSNLKNLCVNFDSFVSEAYLQKKIKDILYKLQKNDATYNKDGKLWLKSSQKGDEKDRVIIKDDNEFTYLAGDIVYHYDKFIRNFDKYINIWGADHHGYISRIKASIDFLGFDSSKLEVMISQMVSILKDNKPYRMSKRAGNFILMQDVIDDIGSDALRFIFLTKKIDTHLEFDINMFNNEDSNNPLYYINYANSRIHSIKAKSKKKAVFDFTNLNDEWLNLLVYALMLNKVLISSFEDRALQKLPEYLKTLATKFHQNYNAFKIIDTESEEQILAVLDVVSFSITRGFSLMGINAKIKM